MNRFLNVKVVGPWRLSAVCDERRYVGESGAGRLDRVAGRCGGSRDTSDRRVDRESAAEE